ncbi:MAG TPA: chemotaxis protein CheC [Bacillota bacterium]|nr:chemotaxis protein CheC [Bacillota bacterium]
MSFEDLSKTQLDVLREIGNIGAGNAATSMAQLINRQVNMNVPSVNVVTFDQMMDILGGPDATVVALFFRFHGDAPGTVYFILTIEKAQLLIKKMTSNDSIDLFDENGDVHAFALSTLKEAGNIMTGSYLSALADFLQLDLQSSIPHISIDMAAAVLTPALVEVSQVSDYAIVINTEINEMKLDTGIHGHFFLIPDVDSFSKIFNKLGIEGNE